MIAQVVYVVVMISNLLIVVIIGGYDLPADGATVEDGTR